MPALSSLSDVLTLLDAVVGHRGAVKRLTDRFGSVRAPRQPECRAYLGSRVERLARADVGVRSARQLASRKLSAVWIPLRALERYPHPLAARSIESGTQATAP